MPCPRTQQASFPACSPHYSTLTLHTLFLSLVFTHFFFQTEDILFHQDFLRKMSSVSAKEIILLRHAFSRLYCNIPSLYLTITSPESAQLRNFPHSASGRARITALHQLTAASTWWCGPRARSGWVKIAVGLPEGPSYPGHFPRTNHFFVVLPLERPQKSSIQPL